jgi:hypothetical protein
MATFDSVFIPAQTRSTKIAALGATTASSEQAFGQNEIVAIVADQNITIRFGAAGAVGTPDATDFLLNAGTYMQLDMGRQWTSFKVFNTAGSACNVYIQKFSKA